MANLKVIILGLFLILLVFLLSLFGTKQEKTFPDFECSEIRECVLMEIPCLDRHVKNDYLGLGFWTWEFDDKAFLHDQKEQYGNKCLLNNTKE